MNDEIIDEIIKYLSNEEKLRELLASYNIDERTCNYLLYELNNLRENPSIFRRIGSFLMIVTILLFLIKIAVTEIENMKFNYIFVLFLFLFFGFKFYKVNKKSKKEKKKKKIRELLDNISIKEKL